MFARGQVTRRVRGGGCESGYGIGVRRLARRMGEEQWRVGFKITRSSRLLRARVLINRRSESAFGGIPENICSF